MLSAAQVVLAFVVGLISYAVYSYYALFEARKKLKWLPAAPRWPIIGSVFEFGGHTETLNDIARVTNNPSKSSFLEIANKWTIVTSDYEFFEFFLSSNQVLDKSTDYQYLNKWLGTGLLTAPGSKWRNRRKIITPAFHFSILEQFVDVFDSNTKMLVKRLSTDAVGKDSVDIYKYVTACALDTICETAMGVNIDTQNGKNQDYVFAVKDMCRIAITRAFSIWRGFEPLFKLTEDYRRFQKNLKILHGLTLSVIEKRKAELENKKGKKSSEEDTLGRKKKMAFLDLLLNSTIDGKPLSIEDIREEVDTFMFEGHDTTSSGISSAFYFLANHPDVQKKVREEQKNVCGDSKDKATTHQDLQDMKYLDMVIKETIRLIPPVPIIGRYLDKDIIFKGHTIPKGTIISIFIYGMNRDPDYYKDPEKFIPERFLETKGEHPYSYVPFSAGPRNCIGQKFAMLEMKSMISKVIRNFELLPTDPPHELLLSSEAVLKSLNGVRIRVRKVDWSTV